MKSIRKQNSKGALLPGYKAFHTAEVEDQIVVTVAYNAGSFQNLPGSHAFAEGVVRQQGTPVVCGADKAAFRQILCHFVPPDEFFL